MDLNAIDTMRLNAIMNAVMYDVPEDEICETDEERLHYQLLKEHRDSPTTGHLAFDTVAD